MKQSILLNAVAKMLRPLVRTALRHEIPYKAFADLLKAVYVDVAANDFLVEGRKQTKARISVLTGLNRKEVQRLLEAGLPLGQDEIVKHNRCARVISAWYQDERFLEDGQPKELQLDGAESFATLVKEYSGDMTVRAVMDELIRTGVAEATANGVRLLSRSYIPSKSEEDKLRVLGISAADLLQTIGYNLESPDAPRYQRYASNEAFPVSKLAALASLSGEEAQALLVKLDEWMSEQELGADDDEERIRAGIGIYVFEDENYRDGETS